MTTTQTALITGASGGIGLELAKLFAADRFDLVLVARSEQALQDLAAELKTKYNTNTRILIKDLSLPQAPQEIYDELQTAGIQVDILVNNAGYGNFGFFLKTDLQKELNMLNLNINALTALTKLFLPAMVAQRSGRILNVASTAAFQPGPLMAVYYASKAYVLSFSDAIANELKGTGVTVTTLCPGPTETGFQKLAEMENSELFKRGNVVMDAQTVARIGYRATLQGKPLIIPGTMNKLGTLLPRFLPRQWVAAVVRRIQAQRQ